MIESQPFIKGFITAKIKPMETHLKRSIVIQRRAFDAFCNARDMAHLGGGSNIQPPRLNGNDLHMMLFIRAVDHVLNEDRTVTPKSPHKLRCSLMILSIREQFKEIELFRHQISWISCSKSLLDSFLHPRSA